MLKHPRNYRYNTWTTPQCKNCGKFLKKHRMMYCLKCALKKISKMKCIKAKEQNYINQKNWQKRNRSKVSAYRREWRKKNGGYCSLQEKEYRKINKEHYNELQRKYRMERKLNNE